MTKKANDRTGKREPPKFVYVLAADGSPLMPTQRLGKVRRMLKLEGVAKSVRADRLRTLRHQGGWTCQGAI